MANRGLGFGNGARMASLLIHGSADHLIIEDKLISAVYAGLELSDTKSLKYQNRAVKKKRPEQNLTSFAPL